VQKKLKKEKKRVKQNKNCLKTCARKCHWWGRR